MSFSAGYATSSSSSAAILSDSERDFIVSGCRANCRMDGRERTTIRPYIVEQFSDLPLCHGSARLLGSVGHASHETQHLLGSVKAELVRPSEQFPHLGVVELYLHMQQQQGGGGNKRDLEHQQDILSQLLTNHVVDTKALCVKAGEYVWKLSVDVWILEAAGGSLLDCATQVILAALQSTRLPHLTTTTATSNTAMDEPTFIEENKTLVVVDGDWQKSEGVPLLSRMEANIKNSGREQVPCWVITVGVLLDYDRSTKKPLYSLIVDATLQEEACAVALVHFCLLDQQIVALHKTQAGALPLTLLADITSVALQTVPSAALAYKYVSSSQLHEKSLNAQKHSSLMLQEQFQWQPNS